MGHNDDVDPTTDVKDRGTLPGIGRETVTVLTQAGVNETVHTFGWYLDQMISDVKAKKATPIISGMVPRNYWAGDTLQSSWPFADYAKQIADLRKVEYVDHTGYSVALFQNFGPVKAKTYFPEDNTHTNLEGAKVNAQTFVQAVKCHCGGKSQLVRHLDKAAKKLRTPKCQPCRK
jgi:rhamnogalacturonan acetylesterase